ncbi:UdgX family uracil-DNA binding protein [Lichenihabitans sp. PAMC28606]|uniref:UdgX family uracil-DNA binding protein n=1 Tax=Lichenihabitans sp. PAMC28606 TaxID=2880932 RepID=UPI0029CABE02|nr:UdgX family uracil-DNA binding protein [Lichenihabitans sp. PAMC28606]
MIYRIDLDSHVDLDGWRVAARRLAEADIPPSEILWRTGEQDGDLFVEAIQNNEPPEPSPGHKPLSVPRRFLELAELAVCHRDPERFTLLYRLLLRFQSEPRLIDIATDDDVFRLEGMAKAVRRDRHKMTAFVRFKKVEAADGPAYVAWFEPEHHIVALTVPFFVDRFANMRWSIITPQLSARWDGLALTFEPGGSKADVPDDEAGDDLWRTYYANIFNPARLKIGAMKREMPVKYWKNLPESSLITSLIRSAQGKENAMVENPQVAPPKRAEIIAQQRVAKAEPRPSHEAGTLEALRDEARSCQRCPLYRDATQTVFGEGLASADLVFVGEQPGDREDLAGKPFIGPAGALFDRALAEAGIDRQRAYVTNAVKHFKFEPRGKRRIHKKPGIAEIDACRWWIEQELGALKPKLTVALGATAVRSLTGKSASILSLRGQVIDSPLIGPVLVTVHPSFLLRLPDEDQQRVEYDRFVADLRLARDAAAG